MWSLLLAATNSTHMLSLEPLRLVQSHISATLPDGGGPDTRQPPAHRLSQTRLALPPISKISSRLILYYVGKFSPGAFVSGGGDYGAGGDHGPQEILSVSGLVEVIHRSIDAIQRVPIVGCIVPDTLPLLSIPFVLARPN